MSQPPIDPYGAPAPFHPPKPPIGPQPVEGIAVFFLDAERRLRTFWRFVIFGIGFVAINFVVGIVVGVPLVIYQLSNSPRGEFSPEEFEANLDHALLFGIASIPNAVLGLALVMLCRRLLDRRTIKSMGFGRPAQSWPGCVVLGLIAGMLPIVLTAALVYDQGGFEWKESSISLKAVLLIPALVFAAFFEEIIFRSYLLQNLLDIRRPIFGILFTSLLFWIIHGLNPSAWSSPFIGVNLFGAGILLALAYMVSGNIWFPTVLHFAWNFSQGILLSIPVSGIKINGFYKLVVVEKAPIWLTGGEFGLEASAVTTLAQGVVISVFLFVWIKQQKAAKEQAMQAIILE